MSLLLSIQIWAYEMTKCGVLWFVVLSALLHQININQLTIHNHSRICTEAGTFSIQVQYQNVTVNYQVWRNLLHIHEVIILCFMCSLITRWQVFISRTTGKFLFRPYPKPQHYDLVSVHPWQTIINYLCLLLLLSHCWLAIYKGAVRPSQRVKSKCSSLKAMAATFFANHNPRIVGETASSYPMRLRPLTLLNTSLKGTRNPDTSVYLNNASVTFC